MRVLLSILILSLSTSSGCMVLDEVDAAAAKMPKPKKSAPSDEDGSGLEELSSREQAVLALTAEGYSSREIGRKLFISPKTVDHHVSAVLTKLGASSRGEAAAIAAAEGYL